MALKIIKSRASGTLSESAFWGMIRSALRQKSRWWLPVKEAKESARRPYVGTNKRMKWEYKCAKCNKWFPDKEVEVDHIIEAGSLRNGNDLKDFIERLFCEKEGLQILCKEVCHREKTLNAKKSLKNL
mgnify:CR=1 FL=1